MSWKMQDGYAVELISKNLGNELANDESDAAVFP